MCANSIKISKCLDQHCNYVHVKGTKRSERKAQQIQKQTIEQTCSHKKATASKQTNNNEDKEMDFLTLLQNLKEEIFNTMDRKIIELSNNNLAMNQPRWMENNIQFTPNQWQTTNPQISTQPMINPQIQPRMIPIHPMMVRPTQY